MAEVEVFFPDVVLDLLLEQPPAIDSSSIALLQAICCRQLNSPYFEVGVMPLLFRSPAMSERGDSGLFFFC